MNEEIYFKYGNEEVNAIDVLKEIAKIGFNDYYYEKQCKAVEIALNYIDKLQKENKYLQERLEFRVRYCNELEHELYEEGNYIHKEVIRKKIKELKEESNGDDYTLINVINILKNLLGE